MTWKPVLHADASEQPGSPEEYKNTRTLCVPNGSLTRAGWQRMYTITTNPKRVDCIACQKKINKNGEPR